MLNIEILPGNMLSSLHVYKSSKSREVQSSPVKRNSVKKDKHYASYRSVKRRGGRILAWQAIKNQYNYHLSVILSCYKFSDEEQNSNYELFSYNLLMVRKRLQKIKAVFRKKYSKYYLLFAVEISSCHIVPVHLFTNIEHDHLNDLCHDIREILGSVAEEYEFQTRHQALFVREFHPAQISYLATPTKYKETSRILGMMNGKNTLGIINKHAVEFYQPVCVSATEQQLASIKRYVFYIIKRSSQMRKENGLNSHQVINIHNNNFTQHGLNEEQVQEIMSRSEEICEGHYDNNSLFVIAIEDILGPEPPYADELSDEQRAEEKMRVQRIKERNWQ